MEFKININPIRRIILIFLAVCGLVFITCQPVIYSSHSLLCKGKEQKAKDNKHQTSEGFDYLNAYQAVVHVAPIYAPSDFILIFEMLPQERTVSFAISDAPPYLIKYFRTLFQVIISPNAP